MINIYQIIFDVRNSTVGAMLEALRTAYVGTVAEMDANDYHMTFGGGGYPNILVTGFDHYDGGGGWYVLGKPVDNPQTQVEFIPIAEIYKWDIRD